MRKALVALLCLVASMMSCTAKAAQTGDFYRVETQTIANTATNVEELIESEYIADNRLRTGLMVSNLMNFKSGAPGASFGVYSIARGIGNPNSLGNALRPGVRDIVGGHFTALKEQSFWAAALHADVYDSYPGGTSIGLNVEFPQTQVGTHTIGINMQPHTGAQGLIGLQIQNPEAFKYALYAPNANWVFGLVDDCPFGMRFNQTTQALELFRSIGKPDETKVGVIKMDFGQAQ